MRKFTRNRRLHSWLIAGAIVLGCVFHPHRLSNRNLTRQPRRVAEFSDVPGDAEDVFQLQSQSQDASAYPDGSKIVARSSEDGLSPILPSAAPTRIDISPAPISRSRINTRVKESFRSRSVTRSGQQHHDDGKLHDDRVRTPLISPRLRSEPPPHPRRATPPPAAATASPEDDRDLRRALAMEVGRALVESRQRSLDSSQQGQDSAPAVRPSSIADPPSGVATESTRTPESPSPRAQSPSPPAPAPPLPLRKASPTAPGTVRYRVVDKRGLALRVEPKPTARLDRTRPRERGVTWLTQGTLVWGEPPANGWVKVQPTGYWLPLRLYGETQLLEASPEPDAYPQGSSSVLMTLPPTSDQTSTITTMPPTPAAPSAANATWLERVRDTALSRWRTRFGSRDDPPPARAVWVRRVPFGMSVKRGGLEVLAVEPGSNAHAMGVRRGDKLIAVAGELVTPSDWLSRFKSKSPPFTILLEPPPPRHPLLGALRAASPGFAHHRPRRAPLLQGFRQPDGRSSFAARPLGFRGAPLPSPSPEPQESVLPSVPAPKKSKDKRQKLEGEQSEEEFLQGDEVTNEVREAIVRMSDALTRAPNATSETADPVGLAVTLLPHQRQALKWMGWRERERPSGGILADEMGLGKTMMMISLIAGTLRANPAALARLPPDARASELAARLTLFYAHHNLSMLQQPGMVRAAARHYAGREPQLNRRLALAYNGSDLRSLKGPTLVVSPAILIHQWQEEMATRCAPKLIDAYVYYGQQRTKDSRELARRDVVLTSYETLVRDIMGPFPNKSGSAGGRWGSPLLQVKWERLVLDEAHMIKNPESRRAKAVSLLASRSRWAVTGTPLQNDMGELFSLMRFLRFAPFNHSKVWDTCIRNSTRRAALLLKSVMLRRTKQMKTPDGSPLVHLPPRTFTLHRLNLTTIEQAIHDTLGNRSRALFSAFIRQRRLGLGLASADTNSYTYASFLCALLRMRQACCHPALLRESLDPASVALALSGLSLDDVNGTTTSTSPNTGAQGRAASRDHVDHASAKEVAEVTTETLLNITSLAEETWVSTKIGFVLGLLRDVRTSRPGDKVVIVSQWTSLLRILELHLQREGWRYVVIDGSVAPSHRKDIISDFNKNPAGAEIMLLSMGAGGVGLNLIGGNHLVLLDIHWNPAMEAQVCDRVYRVGQTKPVFVHKLLCRGTIEDRVQKLQDRKRKLFAAVVPEQGAKGAGDQAGSRLTLEDMQHLFA